LTGQLFDLDGDGSIQHTELHTLLEGLGIKVTEEELLDLVNEADADGSGVIEFEEFVFMMQRFLGEEEGELEKTWALLDADGDGSITQEELCIALEACGMKLAPWELREVITLVLSSQLALCIRTNPGSPPPSCFR